ncbi:LacI family DNA-binding transcriptional regulator [Lactococcus lactis]|uniref:LacI family DNA-binding transcriptional regulator n=1 Tax=Lactococcus lactis TaxID=1358 RepID=UPI0028911C66|nr:LacI family DNA-binding transcriptional regulator [Lactococcus lactis]MDT2851710.1 LacI family DNA-binding transcriptional regulator [Lactococcus lactis]
MSKMTIREIAAMAGVSAMTVSNVIRGRKDRVSEKTRKRILDLIKEYDYVLNQNAANLKSTTSSLIGVLLYNKRQFLDFTDPFVSSILTGVSNRIKEQGYFLMIDIVKSSADIQILQRKWKFSGFVIIGVEAHDFLEIDASIDVPATYVDTYYGEMVNPVSKLRSFIYTDEEEISRGAATYLSQRGHQKVLCYSFDFDESETSVMSKRVQYFQQYFKGEVLLKTSSSSDYQEILESVEEYLTFQPFTAIYATADILAVKLNQIFKDISLLGVDNAPFSEFMSPKLTTMAIDQVEKGEVALDCLIQMIKERKSKNAFLPSRLIIRDSVKKL